MCRLLSPPTFDFEFFLKSSGGWGGFAEYKENNSKEFPLLDCSSGLRFCSVKRLTQ
jgi:hypothetical protein